MSMETPGPSPEVEGELFCYGHPDTPTRLRCSRCDRPICGRCAIPATVGQHCPECVAEARRTAPKVRTTLHALAPATRAILIVTALAFVGQIVIPGFSARMWSYPPAIAAGEWWRLATPMLVHGGAFHLLMNGYVLFILGPPGEQRYGTVRFVAIYLIAGVAGSTASFVLGPCNVRGVGASGAILGVIGALVADLYKRRGSPNARMQMQGLLKWIGIIFAIGIVLEIVATTGFAIIRIDNYAHFGGLVGGAAVGWGVGPQDDASGARGVLVALAVIAAIVALAMARAASFTC